MSYFSISLLFEINILSIFVLKNVFSPKQRPWRNISTLQFLVNNSLLIFRESPHPSNLSTSSTIICLDVHEARADSLILDRGSTIEARWRDAVRKTDLGTTARGRAHTRVALTYARCVIISNETLSFNVAIVRAQKLVFTCAKNGDR